MTRYKQIQKSTSSNRTTGFLDTILIILELLMIEYWALFGAMHYIMIAICTSDFEDAIIPPKSTTTETELDLVWHAQSHKYWFWIVASIVLYTIPLYFYVTIFFCIVIALDNIAAFILWRRIRQNRYVRSSICALILVVVYNEKEYACNHSLFNTDIIWICSYTIKPLAEYFELSEFQYSSF